MLSEAEWLATADLWRMLGVLDALRDQPQWGRKWRLFAVACCRQVGHLFTDRRWGAALEAAERFADAEITEEQLQAAHDAAAATVKKRNALSPGKLACAVAAPSSSSAAYNCAFYVRQLAIRDVTDREAATATWASVERGLCDLLREVIGTPFRPVVLSPTWLAWEGGTVPELALSIYDRRRFAEMPYLGDALEEAGCTSAEVLDHCRGPAKHVRGCWLLDRVLEFS